MLLRKGWNRAGERARENEEIAKVPWYLQAVSVGRWRKKEWILLSLVLWFCLSFGIIMFTLHRDKQLNNHGAVKDADVARLHDLSPKLHSFLASFSNWDIVFDSYSAKHQRIWHEFVPLMKNDAKEKKGPKKQKILEKMVVSDTEEESIRTLILQTSLVGGLSAIDEEHPFIQYFKQATAYIPVPTTSRDELTEDTLKSIVLFSYFPDYDARFTWTYFNIYQYFDDLRAYLRHLQQRHPQQLIVWLTPRSIFDNTPEDLQLIFHHLLTHFVIEHTGVLAIPPLLPETTAQAVVTSAEQVTSRGKLFVLRLNRQLARLYEDLIFMQGRSGDVHTLQWQATAEQISYLAETIHAQFSHTYTANSHSGRQSKSSASLSPVSDNGHDDGSLRAHCFKYINSRKYDPLCMPEPDFRYPLLVTGLGGSGSHFIANQLQDIGFDLPHEGLGKHGAVCWFYSINDVLWNLQYPFGRLPPNQRSFLNPRFDHVVHVVRNPLDQISSFTAHTNKTYDFVVNIMQHTLGPAGDPSGPTAGAPGGGAEGQLIVQQFQQARKRQGQCFRGGSCHLHFATLGWIHWNRLVAQYADKVYHIEQVGHVMEDLCVHLWPEYRTIKTIRGCPDERRVFLTSTFWRSVIYFVQRRFFPSYTAHKKHTHYTLADLERLQSELDRASWTPQETATNPKDNKGDALSLVSALSGYITGGKAKYRLVEELLNAAQELQYTGSFV